MGRKFVRNQVDVINIWASGSLAKAKAGRMRTEGGKLYSYNLLIGQITEGTARPEGEVEHLRLVFDYSEQVSGTTSKHVNLAKRFAHLIYPANRGGNVDWKNPRLGPVILHWKMEMELAK